MMIRYDLCIFLKNVFQSLSYAVHLQFVGGGVGGDLMSTSPESDQRYPVQIHFFGQKKSIHETINLPEESRMS